MDKGAVVLAQAIQRTIANAGKLMPSASHLKLAPLLLLCILFQGCGAYFVGFISNPAGSQTVSGKVNAVRLTSFRDITGEMVTSTEVTFLGSDTATTISFCGDQSSKFPQGSQVLIAFNAGVFCSFLVTVVINS